MISDSRHGRSTTGDNLRSWALGMRSLLEASDGERMTMTLRSGARLAYVLGEGLFVTAGDEEYALPESALDEERWLVA